ncbi:MAG: copper chaperone PCu(A)C [Burkholderiales bacterium]|nr:copper chaperone PCu(A)C [Burkholderiales bacterium]
MAVPRCRKLLAVVAAAAWMAGAQAGEIEVRDAWARATMPGQKVAGVYMTITSAATAARLVGVDSPASQAAEIHEMRHENGVMKMRRREVLELPAGEAVKLAPGGLHIMLMDVKQPLAAGGEVALTLTIEQEGKRRTVAVKAPVKAVGATGDHAHH